MLLRVAWLYLTVANITLFKLVLFMGPEMNVKEIELIEEITARKFIKYYVIWYLIRVAIGLGLLGVAALVSLFGIQWMVNNIDKMAPIPRLP